MKNKQNQTKNIKKRYQKLRSQINLTVEMKNWWKEIIAVRNISHLLKKVLNLVKVSKIL